MKSIYTSLLIFLAIGVSAQKKVLIEQFTNAGCPPCATYTPQVTDYVRANKEKVIMISYHTSFPYLDSMYHENKAESNAAVGFYTVPSVPFTVVDGNQFSNSSASFVSAPDASVYPRTNANGFGTIALTGLSIVNNQLNVDLHAILSSGLIADEYTIKLAIVEEKVLKSSYAASPGKNTETEYYYVMRKMLPDFDGTTLSSNICGTLHEQNS